MATRIYTDATDFDAQQGHFTIEVVDNQYYLRIGALNGEDQRLIGSLIDDGFVGFFQDDVRIGIAGIASTYDAENDRIEIDSELPELQIEDEYVIRFTQARPGEDGIGTSGDDGEHAEIEIEDTDTGIRVRGKSGGEPDFGPWHDVRDGIDGEDGEHAEIEIEDTPPDNENAPGIRVRGKSGGETDFSEWHYVQDGKDGKDGEPGEEGEDGSDGDDGWSPKFATVPDGERRVLQVTDWFGGSGTKPDTGQYIGATGFVTAIADGVDIRGAAGQDGEDGTGICTAYTVLDDSNGTENLRVVELPANYTDYDNIYFNIFGNDEFRQNSLKISTLVNGRRYRVGGISDIVWNETSRTFTLNDGRAAGNFRHVILTGCEDDGGDSNGGEDGWSPKFAIKSDGERRVLQVADWFGGSGTKPDTGQYIGATGFVTAIADGVDIRGPAGEDGADADLSRLVVNTRGVLIATSSFLPELSGDSDRVLNDVIEWRLNTDSGYAVYGTPVDHSSEANVDFVGKFTRGAGVGGTGGLGILNVPYRKPEATVNGLWLVCEDLTDPYIEVWEVFIPWGGGSLEDDQNSTYFDSRYILHWGREGNSDTTDGDDVTVYFHKRRGRNFKSRISIRTYRNERMPSTQCRVKVYLAGVFLTVTETE